MSDAIDRCPRHIPEGFDSECFACATVKQCSDPAYARGYIHELWHMIEEAQAQSRSLAFQLDEMRAAPTPREIAQSRRMALGAGGSLA